MNSVAVPTGTIDTNMSPAPVSVANGTVAPDAATSGDSVAQPDVAVSDVRLFFDWRHPDYAPIWKKRIERLAKLRAEPKYLAACRLYYRDHIPQFIEDWGVTVDPRNVGTERPVLMPFIPFPRQREFLEFMYRQWRGQRDGVLVKSRDCGASWLAMGFSIALCLFWEGVTIGFGSAKEDKVDRSGDPDCLFYKGRKFLEYLPREFKGTWDIRKNSAHMRIEIPHTDGTITGEAGDNIGRGGRKTMYIVDEFAFVERPKLIDASLSNNTRCRIEMSSVQGTANVFAERARGGKVDRFDFHYRDDPRKVDPVTKEMYPDFKQFYDDMDPVVRAQELECDFLASVEGIIIPQDWVQAAINAHIKLGITPTGAKRGAYDVADQGKDKCCYVSAHGILVRFVKSWSGKGAKMYQSTEQAYAYADELDDDGFDFDGDGMGAGVSSDAERIDQRRAERRQRKLRVAQFRGSGKVIDPERKAPGTDRKNEDFFENYKAQCWWALRVRFMKTFQAVVEGAAYDPSELISLDGKLPELTKTCAELSQPVWTWSKSGKMVIDKTPDDVASPNNADGVMMRFGYKRPPISINPATLASYVNAAHQVIE